MARRRATCPSVLEEDTFFDEEITGAAKDKLNLIMLSAFSTILYPDHLLARVAALPLMDKEKLSGPADVKQRGPTEVAAAVLLCRQSNFVVCNGSATATPSPIIIFLLMVPISGWPRVFCSFLSRVLSAMQN